MAAANSMVGYVLLMLGGLYALLYVAIGEHIILIMTAAMLIGLLHTFNMKAEK